MLLKNKKRVFFKTFGCRTNIYDTEVMIENLKDFSIADSENDADIVVINSCTVTNSADSTARNYISKVSRLDKKVIFAGCGAISKGKELFESGKVYGVFGHSEKENINTLLKNEDRFFQIGDLNSVEKSIVQNFEGKNRAFIKIQEGCDFKCSYCIIPQVRGSARSQDEEMILRQIEILASNGYGEFILTGTNMGSYGKDKGSSLGKLLKNISKIRGVKRVRLGSIEPIQIDNDLKEVLGESWLEKHLHIALQHTNSQMLKIMKRRNSYKKDRELLDYIAQKGFAIGTDFIVGHPGESEEFFEDGYEKLKDLPLTHIHCFTYSKRDNTPSSTMKNQVRGDIAKQRHRKIVDLIEKKNYNFRKNKKEELIILIEEFKNGYFTGYDQFYNKMYIKSDKNIDKEWVSIKDYEVRGDANYAGF